MGLSFTFSTTEKVRAPDKFG